MGISSSCQGDWCVKPALMYCECIQKTFCQKCFTLHMCKQVAHKAYSTNQSAPSLTYSSIVYLKSDKTTEIFKGVYKDQEVIIKLQYFNTKSELNRKQEEAALQRSMRHPNICKVLKSYIDEQYTESFKFVMIIEKAEIDLDDEIKRRADCSEKWKEEEVLFHLTSLVDALAFMQRNEMSHRDIKPANILLFENTMKLADFGLSIQDSDLDKSELGVVGTFMYLSPKLMKAYKDIEKGENLSGFTDHNPYKSDVFSLGLSFLYMTSLVPPTGLNFNIEGTTYLHHKIHREVNRLPYSKDLKFQLCTMLEVDEYERPDFIELQKILTKETPGRVSLGISEIPAVESVFEPCQTLVTLDKVLTDICLPVSIKSGIESAISNKKLVFSHPIILSEAEYIKVLMQEHELTEVNLSECALDYKSLSIIFGGKIETIESLVLGSNQIGRKGARVLAQALINMPRLKFLRIWNNKIGNKGISVISENLGCGILELFFGGNKISDRGAKVLAQNIPQSLVVLSLCENLISDEGSRSLALSLSKHDNIKQLYLDRNKINAIGLNYLLLYLPRTLKTLRLLENPLSSDLVSSINKPYKIII